MKAGVYSIPGRSHEDHLKVMCFGLRSHGIVCETFTSVPPLGCDFLVVWSWRVGLRAREYFSGPILVMERGFIGDRFKWTSLGWDGLNGRARFTEVDDKTRFESLFQHLLMPWKKETGYALIAGQVVGDAALIGVDIHKWYRETGVTLWKRGWDVKFRQHPVEVTRGVKVPHVSFAETIDGSLGEALSGASLVVTYNSNTGTDAILNGCPVHTQDEGSMVFDLSSHDLTVIRPDREARLHSMAWYQWSEDEIASGAAWDIVKQSMAA